MSGFVVANATDVVLLRGEGFVYGKRVVSTLGALCVVCYTDNGPFIRGVRWRRRRHTKLRQDLWWLQPPAGLAQGVRVFPLSLPGGRCSAPARFQSQHPSGRLNRFPLRAAGEVARGTAHDPVEQRR